MFKRLLNFVAQSHPDPAIIKAREDAYDRAFGCEAQVYHSTDNEVPHIDLYEYPPAGECDFVTILTGGMGDIPMSIPDGISAVSRVELLMGTGENQNWGFNLLKLVAEYPFDQRTFLHVHHTVPFGGELGSGSTLSAFLFVRPRILPDELGTFEINGNRIGFLQAVAITTEEHRFALEHGSEKLEALLESHDCLITRDRNRRSIV